jgi:hypothetical protein
MKKIGRRTSTAQGGGDFTTHKTGLADSTDNDSAPAAGHEFQGLPKRSIQPAFNRMQAFDLYIQNRPPEVYPSPGGI